MSPCTSHLCAQAQEHLHGSTLHSKSQAPSIAGVLAIHANLPRLPSTLMQHMLITNPLVQTLQLWRPCLPKTLQ